MTTEMNPMMAIRPIVLLDESGAIVNILGTGFFVGEAPTLVTAGHVFHDAPLQSGEAYAVPHLADEPHGLCGLGEITHHPSFDMAAATLQGTLPAAFSLPLQNPDAPKTHLNHTILCYEYSASTMRLSDDGSKWANFVPYAHKGNVMRYYTSEYPETVPTPSLITSFPALQGASGAPVIRDPDFMLIGLMVANQETHLLPAQVVRLEDERGVIDETKYFLPLGKAIQIGSVVPWLREIGAVDRE